MQSTSHQNLVGFIWRIANKLRGPYLIVQNGELVLLYMRAFAQAWSAPEIVQQAVGFCPAPESEKPR